MAEPTIDAVFASTISLLRVLQGFEKQISDIRELQDQVRALSTVLLLIDGTDHIAKIDDQLKQPLLRCAEGCDYLRKIITESTAEVKNLDWKRLFRNTNCLLNTYTSTFMIGYAVKIL
jgi:hypothetical protein